MKSRFFRFFMLLMCFYSAFTYAGSPLGYVAQGGLIWMPVSSKVYNYAQAAALCAGTINGHTGWRLPTKNELSALYASGAMKGQGWMLSSTSSSTSYGARQQLQPLLRRS
ncbi:MAG: hypothetical protein WDM70_07915 [Nitrosomonadales bacterium]